VTSTRAGADTPLQMVSPDGRLNLELTVGDEALTYSLRYGDRTVLLDSPLGFDLAGVPDMDKAWVLQSEERSAHDETWAPVYGERNEIRDHYNQLAVELEERDAPGRRLTLTFRAYDAGIAFNYTFPDQPGLTDISVREELTGFRFPDTTAPAWAVYAAQGEYQRIPLNRIDKESDRPLIVEVADDCYAGIGEARLVDFARMRLGYDDEDEVLRAKLTGRAEVTAPYTTPWRVVMVAPSPNALLQNNDLFLNLNDPCAIADTSWIKPGKIIREVTLTTGGGKACVDFAVQQGIDYIHYDAGWYGHEYDADQDATTVTPDPKRTGGHADLDLHEVIRYAEERGIGVWVYVNRRHLEKQLDEILPLYKQWGLKGVKYGFVRVGDQEATTWLHEAVRKAADHQLMVDIHDEYRPTGWSRTYPNLLTQEGIRGNEEMPTARHNVVTAYARMLCGAGDYTICWYTPRIQTTHPHQLAASVVFYSPLQFVYWYDRPQQFKDDPGTQFLKQIPTVWDDTRILDGVIGEYIVMARRAGDTWYLVALNGSDRPPLEIPLDFLAADKTYRAEIYEDCDNAADDPFCVHERTRTVTQTDTLNAAMAPNGGFAVRLVPEGP
jgi:alpha-glucosidase